MYSLKRDGLSTAVKATGGQAVAVARAAESGGGAAAVAHGAQGGDGGADLFGGGFEAFAAVAGLGVQLYLRTEGQRDVVGAGEGFEHALHALGAVEKGGVDGGAALEGEERDAGL